MHVYKRSSGSPCRSKGAIQSVKRRGAVLFIVCLPTIITGIYSWSGRPCTKAARRVPGAALEPVRIRGLITRKWNKHCNRSNFCVAQMRFLWVIYSCSWPLRISVSEGAWINA